MEFKITESKTGFTFKLFKWNLFNTFVTNFL